MSLDKCIERFLADNVLARLDKVEPIFINNFLLIAPCESIEFRAGIAANLVFVTHC